MYCQRKTMYLTKQLKDLDLVLEASLLTHYTDEPYSRLSCGMGHWHSLRAMLEVFTTSKLRDYGPISKFVIEGLSAR